MAKPWPLNWLEPTSSRQLYHLLLQWQYSLPRWSSSPMLPPTDSMAALKLSECPLLLKAGCLELGMYLSQHLLNYSEPLAPLMFPIYAIQKHNNLSYSVWYSGSLALLFSQSSNWLKRSHHKLLAWIHFDYASRKWLQHVDTIHDFIPGFNFA